MKDRRTARSREIAAIAVAISTLALSSSSFASLYWDADGTAAGNDTTTGAGLGGTGVWGSATNWFDGTNEAPWASGFDAVFTGAAGTVTLGAPQTAASLTFKSDGFSLIGSTLTMDPSPATISVDPNVTATVGSTLAGTATMTKVGAGTLIISNSSNLNTASTAGGGWRIDGGILQVAGDGSFGAPIPDADYNAYTDIQLNQSTIRFAAPMSVSHTRRTKVNTNSSSNLGDGVFDLNQCTVTWYGSIQGGPGSLRVTDHNDNGGLLILGTDKLASINPFGSALPGGTVNLTVENHCVVQTSGTVTLTGGELGSETGAGGAALAILLQTGGQIRSESGGYQFQRNLILGPGGGSLDTGAWEQTFLGTVSGTGGLSKFGTGKLVIDNPSATWAGGTAIHNGTLELGRGGSNGLLPGTLANPSSVVIDAGAKLRFNRGSDKTFYDVISGAGGIEVANGNNAVVRLVSNNTYTGLTTITSGQLMIGQGNAGQPGSIVSDVLDNGVLDFNRVEDITYSGSISGTGALTKEAAGKLSVTGNNIYSGGTNVLAGTLIAANTTGSATGTGPVNVASGAAVGGTGTMSGTVTINSGAHLVPGSSVGTLTVGSLTLSSNSLLDYEFQSPSQASDLTVVTSVGGLVLNGGIVNVTPQAGFGVGEYPLLDYAGSFTGSAGNLSIGSAPSGFSYSFVDNPTSTSIDLVVSVPEPGTALGALIAVSLVTTARRRRRESSH